METDIYRPQQLLAPFIEAYAISYNDISDDHLNLYPSNLPIVCFDLAKKHFKESGVQHDFNFSIGIVGVMDHFIFLDEIPKKSIQVVFKPFGAFRLFNIPMHLIVNKGVDLKRILPNINGFVHQLQDNYQKDAESIRILEQFLVDRLKSSPNSSPNFDRILYACETIKKSKNLCDISTLCQKVGMSETRFRLHFKEKIGISPKKFYQIETFQQIQLYLQKAAEVNWMDLVVKFSFYDQTHFINNFKWFFGCTPTEYLKHHKSILDPT